MIVAPTSGGATAAGVGSGIGTSNDADLQAVSGSDATLGLIADNFVRVYHNGQPRQLRATVAPVVTNLEIDAAILSVKHSFTVDNWDCGKLGTLTVDGAIAQKYRGVVQTFSGATVASGYIKNYWYDDRLRYRSPPYFLDPVTSAWDVVRVHEQVPAR